MTETRPAGWAKAVRCWPSQPDGDLTYYELRCWVARRTAAPLDACLEVVDALIAGGLVQIIHGPSPIEVD